ncbi:MAG: GspH/FimT family pseudopilin [Pseudomonas sp.]|nr:GspH/FimT family pseudopilin [Pseudomonas sp.]
MTVQRGFTLIELLVTIAVAGVLVAIAVPSFKSVITSTRLDTISSELTDTISFARSESVKRNKTITLCRTESAKSKKCEAGAVWEHWLVKQNASSESEDDVIKRGNFSSHKTSIQITTDENISSSKINFNTDGLARSGSNLLSNAHIIVCALDVTNNSIRKITLNAAGHTYINKESGVCP